MTRFFFLRYPTLRKAGDRSVWRANIDDRNDLVEHIGEEAFNSDSHYEYLRDLPIPPCFEYIWRCFLEIRNYSGEQITWTNIYSWCRMRKVDLTQKEIDYLMLINGFANKEIERLREEE